LKHRTTVALLSNIAGQIVGSKQDRVLVLSPSLFIWAFALLNALVFHQPLLAYLGGNVLNTDSAESLALFHPKLLLCVAASLCLAWLMFRCVRWAPQSRVWRDAWRQCKLSVVKHRRLAGLAALLALMCMLYPSDLDAYRATPPMASASAWLSEVTNVPVESMHPWLKQAVDWVEHNGRFIETGAQILVPLVLLDKVGGVQLLYLGVATTAVTQISKRLFNGVTVAGTRVGERPKGGNKNVPSGHSSMAASALGFLWRRYGAFHIYYLLPILVATMMTRVFLSAHTISAVLAGALIGLVMAYVMTTPRPPPQTD